MDKSGYIKLSFTASLRQRVALCQPGSNGRREDTTGTVFVVYALLYGKFFCSIRRNQIIGRKRTYIVSAFPETVRLVFTGSFLSMGESAVFAE